MNNKRRVNKYKEMIKSGMPTIIKARPTRNPQWTMLTIVQKIDNQLVYYEDEFKTDILQKYNLIEGNALENCRLTQKPNQKKLSLEQIEKIKF